jgi:uncharacterized ion transporter superfamily protein YfcC
MLKTTLVAAAAALIATGLGVWATSPDECARAVRSGVSGINLEQGLRNRITTPRSIGTF